MTKTLIGIITAIIVLAGALWYSENFRVSRSEHGVSGSATTTSIPFTIEDRTYTAQVAEGISVLNAMHFLASTTDLTFTTKEFTGLGALVESINGKANSNDSYWFLYVNGTSTVTGASQVLLKVGDSVEWKYKKAE